jgi:hypothetical protein
MFKNFYQFVFYRLYQWQKRVNGDIGEYTTIIIMTILLMLNISSLLFIIRNLTDLYIIIPQNHYLGSILGTLIMSSPLYFIFIFKKKYIKILEIYENKTVQYKKKMTLILCGYIILSLIIFISSAYLYVM